jgi:hypothetical protein
VVVGQKPGNSPNGVDGFTVADMPAEWVPVLQVRDAVLDADAA